MEQWSSYFSIRWIPWHNDDTRIRLTIEVMFFLLGEYTGSLDLRIDDIVQQHGRGQSVHWLTFATWNNHNKQREKADKQKQPFGRRLGMKGGGVEKGLKTSFSFLPSLHFPACPHTPFQLQSRCSHLASYRRSLGYRDFFITSVSRIESQLFSTFLPTFNHCSSFLLYIT